MSEALPSAHEGHDSDVETLRISSSDLGGEHFSVIKRARRPGARVALANVGILRPYGSEWNHDADGGTDEVT